MSTVCELRPAGRRIQGALLVATRAVVAPGFMSRIELALAAPSKTAATDIPRGGAALSILAAQQVPHRRHHVWARLAGDRILVAGGVFEATVTAQCDVYDVASNQWYKDENLATARWRHAAAALPDGRILDEPYSATGTVASRFRKGASARPRREWVSGVRLQRCSLFRAGC